MDDLISRKAAIEAATDAYHKCLGSQGVSDAIRALPSVGVTVKPLEWVDMVGRTVALAASIVGNYEIKQDGAWNALWFNGSRISGALPSIEAAKAAAQADYEARILAALDVQPTPAKPDWIDNCEVCNRIVDTREKAEGGDGHGCQYGDKWACSSACAEVLSPDPDWLRDALAAPAPAPSPVKLGELQEGQVYYIPELGNLNLYAAYTHHANLPHCAARVSRGIVHLAKENAIAHAQAMLALGLRPAPDVAAKLKAAEDYANEITPNGSRRIENITGLFSDKQADHIRTQIDLAFKAGWYSALARKGGGV